ncbi:MAG: Xaa-Pro peptidase family protein [Saccharofermentans sp.]|nr:Xaa-Pro peptidase family protein [Saccharofermentans sp.]
MAIDKSFFINKRDELMSRLPKGTAVVLFAGSSRAMSQDTDYRFLPDRNFYYLTGLEIETCRLILTNRGEKAEVKLFAPGKDDMVERWHGKRLTKEQISAISGIAVEDIYADGDYDEALYDVEKMGLKLASDGTSIMAETKAFMASDKVVEDIGPVLTSMRMIKSTEEVDAIRKAAAITEEALLEMKSHVRPGVTEIELYTALEYGMAKRGSLIPAFTTITAIGSNSFYLHHGNPEGEDGVTAKEIDHIQVDVGARVDGYCADISRAYFVGGATGDDDKRFKLLALIQKLRKEAFAFIKPGETFTTLNQAMHKIVGEFLVDNNLATNDPDTNDIKRYYWHNTSHHLGLDVHDISDREKPFMAGNCLAVEPGVYIPEWGVGFRIEDDVYVTTGGCELISSGDDKVEGIVI